MTAPTPAPTARNVAVPTQPAVDPPPPDQVGEPLTESPSSAPDGFVFPELVGSPEVGFLLLAGGLLALNMSIADPQRVRIAAAAGVILTSGLLVAAALPISAAAGYFLALAAASFLLEMLTLPGMFLHAAGGAFALSLAGLCLREPWAGAHPALVLPIAALVGAGTAYAARRSWRYARIDPFDSSPRLIGREATVLTAQATFGEAVIAGAVWRIFSPSPLHPGDTVTVTARRGELLVVRPRTHPRGFRP